MTVTLDEMLALRQVVDTGSISAAAEQMGQTPSGISRALSRLETKLDTSLLHRTTRRLSLTDEGQAFLAQARRILSAVDEAEEQARARRSSPAGRLRVNAAMPFMLHVLAPIADRFQQAFPLIDLQFDTDELPIDLLAQDAAGPGGTDVAIRIGPLRDSTLRARPLGSTRLRVLASPGYLARHGTPASVEELATHHRLLGFNQPGSLNRWPLRGAHGDRLVIQPALLASSGETLRALALGDAGIACLSDFMTQADRTNGHLVELLSAHAVEVLQPIHAVFYRNSQLAARIACFLDFLGRHMQAQAWCVR